MKCGETEWNGLIVSADSVSGEEESLLAERGIRRVVPAWASVFEKARVFYPPQARAPYEVSEIPLIIEVCDCFDFVADIYSDAGLDVSVSAVGSSQYGLAIDCEDLVSGDLIYVHDPRLRLQALLGSVIHHVGIVSETGKVIHAADGENCWEGSIDDFIRHGRFLIGRRLVGSDLIATFAFEGRRSAHKGFSLENRAVLRSYL